MNKLDFIKDFDFSKLDFVLLTLFLVLGLFGLLVLSSASAHFSDSVYGNPSAIFNRQFFLLYPWNDWSFLMFFCTFKFLDIL